VRDRLRVRKIDGLPFLQPSTEFPLHFHRANLDTGLAEYNGSDRRTEVS
jgi:hypothetical protein